MFDEFNWVSFTWWNATIRGVWLCKHEFFFFFYDFESHFKELWNRYLMCRIGSILFANGIGFSFWTWNMNFFLFIWFCVYFDELDILYDELNLVLTKWDRSWIMVHGLFWWFIEPDFLCFGTHSTPAWPFLTCNSIEHVSSSLIFHPHMSKYGFKTPIFTFNFRNFNF